MYSDFKFSSLRNKNLTLHRSFSTLILKFNNNIELAKHLAIFKVTAGKYLK